MITELKAPKSASSRRVRDVLITALENIDKEKALSVCLCICTEDSVITDWEVTDEGDYSDAVGGIRKLEQKVLQEWDEE